MNLYAPHVVKLDTATAGNRVDITEIASVAYDPQTRRLLRRAGTVTRFVGVLGQAHRIEIATGMVGTLLAKNSSAFLLNGLAVDSGAENAGAEIWYRRRLSKNTFASGSNHVKLTVADGFLLPRNLSVENQGVASLALGLLARYDGTNQPVVAATGEALTDAVQTAAEWYTLGPTYLGDTLIEDVQGWSLNAGVVEHVRSGGGSAYPVYIGLADQSPSLAVRVLDVGLLATLGVLGAEQTVTLYLRKKQPFAAAYADNTENHIKIVIESAHCDIGEIRSNFGEDAEPGLVLTPRYDGTNAVVAVTTDCAIVAPSSGSGGGGSGSGSA